MGPPAGRSLEQACALMSSIHRAARGRCRYGGHMPPGAKQLKRRNHTVNKSYLRRFADERGKLTMVTLPGDDRVLVSVDDATVIKNFYVVRLPDGSETDVAEDEFSKVEGRAAAAITALIDRRVWPIPDGMRVAIADWAALQYLRVPWVRQLTREFAEVFSDVGVTVRTSQGERVTMRMPPGEADRQGTPAFHLEFIRRQAARAAMMLCERNWVLTFYKRKGLVTSDTPVVLRPMLNYPAGMTVALGDAAEIQVALDRRVALSMVVGSRGDRRVHGTTKTAADLNAATVANSRRFVFHHPSECPLTGLALPEPRKHELTSPEAAAARLGDLFSLEDASQPSLSLALRAANSRVGGRGARAVILTATQVGRVCGDVMSSKTSSQVKRTTGHVLSARTCLAPHQRATLLLVGWLGAAMNVLWFIIGGVTFLASLMLMAASFQGLSEYDRTGWAGLAGVIPPMAVAALSWYVVDAIQSHGTFPSARGASALTLAWVAAGCLTLVFLAIGDRSPEMTAICGAFFLAFALSAFLLGRGGFWPPNGHGLATLHHAVVHSQSPTPAAHGITSSRPGSTAQHGGFLANSTLWAAVAAMAAVVSAIAAVAGLFLRPKPDSGR